MLDKSTGFRWNGDIWLSFDKNDYPTFSTEGWNKFERDILSTLKELGQPYEVIHKS
jgi:hypothetical protein